MSAKARKVVGSHPRTSPVIKAMSYLTALDRIYPWHTPSALVIGVQDRKTELVLA